MQNLGVPIDYWKCVLSLEYGQLASSSWVRSRTSCQPVLCILGLIPSCACTVVHAVTTAVNAYVQMTFWVQNTLLLHCFLAVTHSFWALRLIPHPPLLQVSISLERERCDAAVPYKDDYFKVSCYRHLVQVLVFVLTTTYCIWKLFWCVLRDALI